MKIGVPKEVKDQEYRVALTPDGAAALVAAGHAVFIEHSAGAGSGFDDAAYVAAGAKLGTAEEAWAAALVLKVKEPLVSEYRFLGTQTVFTFFHLAGVDPALTEALLRAGTTAAAYETLEDAAGRLPLLAPMSAIAGNMASQMGAYYLARFNGGRGTQLGKVMGRSYGEVLIVGDGVVGSHAARTAIGLGAEVTVVGLDPLRGTELAKELGDRLHYRIYDPAVVADKVRMADLLIGAILHKGARADSVVSESMVRSMPPGAVIVDVSIDQGGCIETSRPTSHSDPVYVRHGVIHYCVTNMPGAYPRTSTLALTHATLPYVLRLAAEGTGAFRYDAGFAKAVNACGGYVTCRAAAESLGISDRYRPLETLI
ncbi:alanine dehydrogenase [Methylolobus aquaticus]|nr:alanine dehydrogenase [Methylolobus aquaticus]